MVPGPALTTLGSSPESLESGRGHPGAWGLLWCNVPGDCGSNCAFEPRGGKKKRIEENKYIFAFPQVESGTISSHRASHSRFLKPWDFRRVDTCKPLCPRPVNSWHLPSPPGGSEGWWDLGTLCEASREGWVLSFEGGFFGFQSLSVVFSLPALPRHFHTGMRGWESCGMGTAAMPRDLMGWTLWYWSPALFLQWL